MVKQDHVPSVFFEHDLEHGQHDPFGLHAFYSTPIGPNFHSRRAAVGLHHDEHHLLHHPRPYIHQEPKDDIFALRGEPLPPQLQTPAAFRPENVFAKSSTPAAYLLLNNNSSSNKKQQQQQSIIPEPASTPFAVAPAATLASTTKTEDKDDTATASTSASASASTPLPVTDDNDEKNAAAAAPLLTPSITETKLSLPTKTQPAAAAAAAAAAEEDKDTITKSISAPASVAAKKEAKGPAQPKKRTRPVSACEGCRAKKVKCNLKPDLPICENCSAVGKPCLFRIDDLSPAFRAQRFGAYGPPGENARTIGGGGGGSSSSNSSSNGNGSANSSANGQQKTAARPADEIPGETASQRRLRRKRAREALLATGQRPPKAKAVFKSWANPSKLAAPCMPAFTFSAPSAAASAAAAGISLSSPLDSASPSAQPAVSQPFAFAPQLINASGVYHASATATATALSLASPPATATATAMPIIGSWDSATSSSANGAFPHSFGALSFEATLGSPLGSAMSTTTSAELQQAASTPGLTDASGEALVMSPFSSGGGGGGPGLSPTATTAGGASSHPGRGGDFSSLSALTGSMRFASGSGHGGRPEMHARRHTTAGASLSSLPLGMATSPFGGSEMMMPSTPMSIHPPGSAHGLGHQYPFPSSSSSSFGGGAEGVLMSGSMQSESSGGGSFQDPATAALMGHHFHQQQQQQQQQQQHSFHLAPQQQQQHHHHRSSTGSAFFGGMNLAGGQMHHHIHQQQHQQQHTTGGAGLPGSQHGATPSLFEDLTQMQSHAPPPLLPHAAAAMMGMGMGMGVGMGMGMEGLSAAAAAAVPVDLSSLGMGMDDFMSGFEMSLV
ncbi:hypothetical protein OC842_003571 [Tilletia horrida]|uniref:Zn(2)-C6 fungal-type domain-containing protein n=1 Tax=Tilletia horrida TaxID=155126 RepID=A0AAN6JKM6_9BASI|nr:hypothetical protein OC842_003571 [Tilletia horrida]